MKYINEYKSFDVPGLFEPIDDSDLEEYYQYVMDPPKNIEDIILNSEDLKGLYSKIEYDPEYVFDVFKCFQILLEYEEAKTGAIKGLKKITYHQIHLNTFYISDEYFICSIQIFKSYNKIEPRYHSVRPGLHPEWRDYYTYKCDSIEGLISLIKNIREW